MKQAKAFGEMNRMELQTAVSSCKALMDRLIKGGVDAHGTTKPGLQDELDISFDKEGLNYLGINICRDRDNKIMKLSQFGYISKAIASFPLNNPSRPAMNPYLRDKLSQAPDKDDNLNPIAQELYQSLTGTLLYLAIGTRPDILCSVHDRTRKMQQATNRDSYAAQRILRYIMHTYDRCITFDGQQPLEVFGYADSTFNTDADRKSKFGYYQSSDFYESFLQFNSRIKRKVNKKQKISW